MGDWCIKIFPNGNTQPPIIPISNHDHLILFRSLEDSFGGNIEPNFTTNSKHFFFEKIDFISF